MIDGRTQPQWWTDGIAAAWSRSREAAINDWRRNGEPLPSLDDALAERALAFGHGARGAYSHVTTWDELAPQLRADWSDLGNVHAAAWERVAAIIRHEWLRAAGPGGDAAPEAT